MGAHAGVVADVRADGANAVSSLSLDPPLVLVCFDRASTTLEAVRAHGAFAVNVLAAHQQDLSANFARRGLTAVWDGVRHRPGPTGSPRLHGVLATLECTVEHRLPGGDHEGRRAWQSRRPSVVARLPGGLDGEPYPREQKSGLWEGG